MSDFTTLHQLSPYEKVTLVGVDVPSASVEQIYLERLASLGLIPGMVFTFIRSAPLGDPVEILVRGTYLLLRKQEAAVLTLKRVAS